MPKVLFIANHRLERSPGQRFRFEQYLGHLKENGFDWELSNIISETDDKILYQKGKYFQKAKLARKAWKIRSRDVARANEFDIIFIFREALLTGSSRFERAFSKSRAKVIFDFDDAIWLPNVSLGNKKLQKLKNPAKTSEIIQISDLVFAGNNYLAAYAKKYNQSVRVIPTTIDTNYHTAQRKFSNEVVCIGWTGTQTTVKYLDSLTRVFKRLKEKFGEKICFKVISDYPWNVEGVDVQQCSWSLEDEILQLSEIDIGVMPLTDDQWSNGKCGFKALQYMSLQTVPVVSPVGVNCEIIQDGVNGFLAKNDDDWYRKLSLLVENIELRKKLSRAARKTVIVKYSVQAYENVYLQNFNDVIRT
ncbi:MAG: glycosyl transferase family 1 [Verrucomicrobia bacterium]|nr:glycosyl transferase family 1 [Verrucomicrobiota bacterium]